MGIKSFISGKKICVALLFCIASNVQADVVNCSTHVALSTQNITSTNIDQQNLSDTNEAKVKGNKQTKKEMRFLGMFKLLIPDTLR